MAVLPVIPSFLTGDSSLARLQQLSAAVSFCARSPVIFHGYKTATQAISTFPTAITWTVMCDSDAALTTGGSTRYTAQTPGYFHMDATVALTPPAVNNACRIYMQQTNGPNNPAGAGTTIFNQKSDDCGTSATVMSLATSGITPYLYIGDFVEVFLSSSAASVTVQNAFNTSGNNDPNGFPDGGCYWTGTWISEGP